jgi:hypothetical protein
MGKGEPTVVVTWMGGVFPTQIQGTIDGNPFFFSERGGEWDLLIVPPGCDPLRPHAGPDSQDTYYAVGRMRWEEPHCDSYADALALIERYAREFARDGWMHTPAL